ncbi:aspartate racemase [Acetomicrobium mobile DSM 13181]|uniref:Aspartate racemase n=1 Tax=Acetomicrobium mobile (strain ATCC BAA-54 / DSM 13181 / JCM 12221 / NGA) TaxID=891968 RepID=I4BZB1_ACEMN|nr:aspartate/glutamate racemase family protein [Acetomicrobium mobile]AFM22618.1 aspartate racemase [Acetomicrobium mobile DSM 13181]
MKVGIVYTSTTPELIDLVEKELRKKIGEQGEFISFQDPTILTEVVENNYVTAGAAARLISLYTQAIASGADVILNCCSSVGEVVDSVQGMGKFIGVPIIRIDEEMCREATRRGRRIGVMATLSSTLNPTKNTIFRVAREINRRVEVTDALLDGAFGLSREVFSRRMIEKAMEIADDVDVILFAQGSMAYCEESVHQCCGKPVLSSPRFGAAEVRRALESKGLI